MKINSHGWLKTALHRLPCIYIILWKYLNKHPTGAAALIQGRRLLTFPLHVRRLIEGGACSSKHGIYQHVRNVTFRNESNTVSLTIYLYTSRHNGGTERVDEVTSCLILITCLHTFPANTLREFCISSSSQGKHCKNESAVIVMGVNYDYETKNLGFVGLIERRGLKKWIP